MGSYKEKNISYGIACCRKSTFTKEYEILFIKKRLSYSFKCFLTGTYNINNKYSILKLLNTMTINEKIKILVIESFEHLWCEYKQQKIDKIYNKNKFMGYKKKFESLKEKDNGLFFKSLLEESDNTELIWEVPKGHSEGNEEPLKTAIREFKEETNIDKKHYKILYDVKPVVYSFIDNNIHYVYKYYIAIMKDSLFIPNISFNNIDSRYEISDIKFCSQSEIKFLNKNEKFIKFFQTIKKIAKNHNKK
jgi:ADP-ribose pyrophosphatase YjhB (NUDIX family)